MVRYVHLSGQYWHTLASVYAIRTLISIIAKTTANLCVTLYQTAVTAYLKSKQLLLFDTGFITSPCYQALARTEKPP